MANNPDFKQYKEEAYRIISENPCGFLPEFEFERKKDGWSSRNTMHADGTPGTKRGKVWIYDSKPGYLYDFRAGNFISFWDYLEKVRGDASPFPTLMEYAGLSLPNDSYNPNEKIELVASTHPFILRKCLTIFAEELGNTDIGCEVRAYLAQRDYTDTDIDRMKLGALPELSRLQARLEKELNIEQKFINFFCKSMENYQHHPLAIPCYGKHGALEGFIFRSIDPDALPETEDKYKNMSKLNRDASVLNIPRNTKEIVIIEGVLDALLAKARGARNVVSLNGTGLNDAQMDALAELGIERVIMCLDNDDAGSDATFRHTKRLLAHEHPFEVYITELSEKIKDVDELITKHGIEAFYDAIHYSIGMGEYLAKELIKAYPKRYTVRPLPAMQRKRLMDVASSLQNQLSSFTWELRDFQKILEKYIES